MAIKKSLAIFGFISLVNLSYAYAQNSQCDAIVLDEARIFGNQTNRVEEAAKKVINLGAEVRVRTFSKGSNLDFVQDEWEAKCQSWRASDGGTRHNLVSLLMAVDDRQFGFYAGLQWKTALDSRWVQIENDYVFPRFRDGNFTEAFVAGLGQIARVIDAQVNGSLNTSNTTPV